MTQPRLFSRELEVMSQPIGLVPTMVPASHRQDHAIEWPAAVSATGAINSRAAVRGAPTSTCTYVRRHHLMSDGVFVDDDGRLASALHPLPTAPPGAHVLAILMHRASDRAAPRRRGVRR